jgi:hypothetical protein
VYEIFKTNFRQILILQENNEIHYTRRATQQFQRQVIKRNVVLFPVAIMNPLGSGPDMAGKKLCLAIARPTKGHGCFTHRILICGTNDLH